MKHSFPLSRIPKLLAMLGMFSVVAQVQAEQASLTYVIPEGTTYLGIPLLRPAVLRGEIQRVVAPDRLQASLSEHLPMDSKQRYFLEITSSPQNPTLEGERWNLWVSGATVSFPSAEIHLRLDHAGNTRKDLPAELAGCRFSVHPHWTVSAVFGGDSGPSPLRARRLIASADRVTLERAGVTSSYFLEQAAGHPHGRWRHTRGLTTDPTIEPGSGLILDRKGTLFRLTLSGEIRQHLLRRPLAAGLNLISSPSLQATTIRDLQLTPQQGWQTADQLTIWRGSSPRRYRWEATSAAWLGLDSILGMDAELAPLIQPTAAFLLKKAAADPDFALRPIP
jgi:hypothetical protein